MACFNPDSYTQKVLDIVSCLLEDNGLVSTALSHGAARWSLIHSTSSLPFQIFFLVCPPPSSPFLSKAPINKIKVSVEIVCLNHRSFGSTRRLSFPMGSNILPTGVRVETRYHSPEVCGRLAPVSALVLETRLPTARPTPS